MTSLRSGVKLTLMKKKRKKKSSELGTSVGISRILMLIGVLGAVYGGGFFAYYYTQGYDMERIGHMPYYLYVGIIVFVIGKILNKGYDKFN